MSRKKQYFPEFLLRRFYIVDATKSPLLEGYYITSLTSSMIANDTGDAIKGYLINEGNAWKATLNCKKRFSMTFGASGYNTITFNDLNGLYLLDAIYPMFPTTVDFGAHVNWDHNIVHDLDTHVVIVDRTLQQTVGEVNYQHKTVTVAGTTVKLDVDDTGSGNGETITFDSLDSNHIYYFVLYNYSYRNVENDNHLSSSSAEYNVVLPNSQSAISISCPTSGSGRFWEVFSMVGNSNQITLLNNITDNNTYLITSI